MTNKSNTRIRLFFSQKRIGYRMRVNDKLEVCYRDQLLDNPLEDFKAWLAAYDIEIDYFISDHAGLFAYTKEEIKSIPNHDDKIYLDYMKGAKI